MIAITYQTSPIYVYRRNKNMTEPKIITNVRITAVQRAIFQKLGGVKWLRRVLDREAKKLARAEKSS